MNTLMSYFGRYALLAGFVFAGLNPLNANPVLPIAHDHVLRAGIVGLDIQPKLGIPLAGYGDKLRRLKHLDWDNTYPESFFFKPAIGEHTPIRSKTLVLHKDGKTLVFISIDTIGVEKVFVSDLAKKLAPLGVNEEDLIVAGTHTHSGPGTLSRTLPLELVAVDLFKRKNYDYVLARVTQSVHVAMHKLEPAELFTSSFEAEGMQRNKFRRKNEQHYNKQASFLLAKSQKTQKWLGGIVNFAVHGGGMPVDDLRFSSDFPGQIEMSVEDNLRQMNGDPESDVGVLFINGAEGDVAVGNHERGVEIIEEMGREFGRQSRPALEAARAVTPEFSVKRERIWLGIPAPPLKYCLGDNSFLRKSPVPLRIPIVPFMTQRSYLSIVKVGEITMLTWPGEPSTQLGFDLQAAAKKHGVKDPWILGLTSDYMAYFTTKAEYNEGAYDSCSSEFNWRGGKRIIRRYDRMLKAL